MKQFFISLMSDKDDISSKRFIGLLSLLMYIAYGIAALFQQFNEHFWIFYISLLAINIWIAFKFMTADKILKYDVMGSLAKFSSQQVLNELTHKPDKGDNSDDSDNTNTASATTGDTITTSASTITTSGDTTEPAFTRITQADIPTN